MKIFDKVDKTQVVNIIYSDNSFIEVKQWMEIVVITTYSPYTGWKIVHLSIQINGCEVRYRLAGLECQ